MAEQPNLELLRRGYPAYGSGDMDTVKDDNVTELWDAQWVTSQRVSSGPGNLRP
jgi:hypothetical protein